MNYGRKIENLNPQRLMIAVGYHSHSTFILGNYERRQMGRIWLGQRKCNLLMMKTTRKCGLFIMPLGAIMAITAEVLVDKNRAAQMSIQLLDVIVIIAVGIFAF